MQLPSRAIPLAWVTGLLLIGSLAGTVLISHSIQTTKALHVPSVEAPRARVDAPNVLTVNSSAGGNSHVSSHSSTATIERAQQQLARLASTSDPAGSLTSMVRLDSPSLLDARTPDFDADAYMRFVMLTTDIRSAHTWADTSLPLGSLAAESVADVPSSGERALGIGGGGGGGGQAGLGGGGFAASGADSQQALFREALLTEQEASTETRAVRGPADNAASRADEHRTPGRSDDVRTWPDEPHATIGKPESDSHPSNRVASVPEPSSLLLLGLGLGGLSMMRRRR